MFINGDKKVVLCNGVKIIHLILFEANLLVTKLGFLSFFEERMEHYFLVIF